MKNIYKHIKDLTFKMCYIWIVTSKTIQKNKQKMAGIQRNGN